MLWKSETDGVQVVITNIGKLDLAAQSPFVVCREVGEVGVRRLSW